MAPNDLIIVDETMNNLDNHDIVEISDAPLPDLYDSDETGIKIVSTRQIKPSEGPKFVNHFNHLVSVSNKINKFRPFRRRNLSAIQHFLDHPEIVDLHQMLEGSQPYLRITFIKYL